MGIRPWGFSGVGLGGHAWCGALAPAGVVLGTGSGPAGAGQLGEVGVYPTTNGSFSAGALVTSLLPFSLAVVVEW